MVTNGNYFARLILEPLLTRMRTDVVGILLVSGDYAGRTGLHALWHVGRRTDPHYTAYKVIQYGVFRAARLIWRRAWFEVQDMARALRIPCTSVARVNSDAGLAFCEAAQPDLLVSVSCPQRIRRRLLEVPRVASLNVHSSLLPRYAGLAPYYWVLSRGERQTGVSVHYMTEQFDEGNVLVQKVVPITPGTSAFNLFTQLARAGGEALVEAVPLALSGEAGEPQDLTQRSYFSHPTPDSYRELKRRGFAIARWSEILQALREEVAHADHISAVLSPSSR